MNVTKYYYPKKENITMNMEKNGFHAKRLYSYLPFLESPRAYALIDTEALVHNYEMLCSKAFSVNPNATPIATVKADAYGHSASICVPALLSVGCRFFAVSSIEEALDVRHITEKKGVPEANILILGYTDPKYIPLAAENNITLSLVSEEYAEKLLAFVPNGKNIKVHIAVDTGMNRLGYLAHGEKDIERSSESIAKLFECEKIGITGMFSHFFAADMPGEEASTEKQYGRFIKLKDGIEKRGFKIPMIHICNTAGIMHYTDFTLDAFRMGISLYGSDPYDEENVEDFKPVMKLCSIVSHIHTVKAGESVGYGGTYVAQSDRRIATIPIGYADGFIRAYGGAYVTVCGKKAKIVGRICMDQCMIDISDIEGVEVGDEVILFGNDPKELKELANMAGTIEYECLCIVSSRIPRIRKNEKL